MRRALGLFAIAMSIAVATPAGAQPQQPPNPEAVRHFQEGKRLRDEKRYVEAVNELKASLAIEKTIGAHYNLAVCFENLERHREAFEEYQRAIDLATEKKDDRLREIKTQQIEFLGRVPYIRLAVPKELLDVGVKITVDGDPIARSDIKPDTKYFPPKGDKDKKEYLVVVSAPGYEDTPINVDAASIRRPEKEPIPVVMRRQGDRLQPPPARTEEGGWTWQHFAGIGGIVVGAAGVTIALANVISYDLERGNLEDKFNQACALDKDPKCSDTERAEQTKIRADYDKNENEARKEAPLWLGAGIGGALLIGGGVILLVTAPAISPEKKPEPATGGFDLRVVPAVGARQQGLSVVGRF